MYTSIILFFKYIPLTSTPDLFEKSTRIDESLSRLHNEEFSLLYLCHTINKYILRYIYSCLVERNIQFLRILFPIALLVKLYKTPNFYLFLHDELTYSLGDRGLAARV